MPADVNTGTEKLLAEIEARANAATEGPWRLKGDSPYLAPNIIFGHPRDAFQGNLGQIASTETGWNRDADAEFIAHAREDVPWLIEQLRTVLAERDEARAGAKHWKRQSDIWEAEFKEADERIDNAQKAITDAIDGPSMSIDGKSAILGVLAALTATETSEQ